MKNHYITLEIENTATIEQIKKAYRLKAVKYHPDKHFGDKHLTEIFIEIKEAYDILSDDKKRKEYDLEYNIYYLKEKENKQKKVDEENQKNSKKEEQFVYDPLKPFYSFEDRNLNETPHIRPNYDHFGAKLADNIDFFVFPKNIGRIISGFSTLTKEKHPLSGKDMFIRFTISIGVALIFSTTLIFLFKVINPVWLVIWLVIPPALAILITKLLSSFSHVCSFIGVSGFAQYKCFKNRNSITDSFEINFNNLTDFIKISSINKNNFTYTGTTYTFVWLKEDVVVKEVEGMLHDINGKPETTYPEFWLHEKAEKYWTIFLLDKMEKEIESNGYLTFSLYGYENYRYQKLPYIHLGVGYIKFISFKEKITFNFNEIKNIYLKDSLLYIEHNNFENKTLNQSGNQAVIPLTNLSNIQFFLKALELLIGYRL